MQACTMKQPLAVRKRELSSGAAGYGLMMNEKRLTIIFGQLHGNSCSTERWKENNSQQMGVCVVGEIYQKSVRKCCWTLASVKNCFNDDFSFANFVIYQEIVAMKHSDIDNIFGINGPIHLRKLCNQLQWFTDHLDDSTAIPTVAIPHIIECQHTSKLHSGRLCPPNL